jgi:hypothetical protein
VSAASSTSRRPDLSVVVVGQDGWASVRQTVAALQAQTVRDRLELIVVAPTAELLAGGDGLEAELFHGVRTAAVGPIDNPDRAAVHGIRLAAAPVVAIVEDHAYPEPEWAEALLRAHRGAWVAVGSAFANANPATALSWANLLLAYGLWVEPVAGGETGSVSRHNLSFKREPLLAIGAELDAALGRDGGLLHRLRASGHRLFLEPAARIRHANPSRLVPTVALRFDAGRLAAATRARLEGWSRLRRLAYVLAGPLIPLLRLRPIHQKVFRAGLFPRVYPALALCLVLDALGQMLGFALGPGDAARRLAAFEVDRLRHLTRRDRIALKG